MMLKTMFVGPDDPPKQKMPAPPAPDQKPAQDAAHKAMQRAALARGRSSTVISGGGLGNVGSS